MKTLFKYISLAITIMVLAMINPETALASSAEITNQNDGTVRLNFQNDYDVKIKLIVQLTGGTQYKYDIPKGSVDINIPMTQGNGDYKFILCRNIAGTRYAVMQTVNVTQTLANDSSAFTASSYIINWSNTNAAIKKAQSLAKKGGSKNKIIYIYEYVVKNYKYDFDKAKNIDDIAAAAAYIPDITKIYKEKKGICYDYSVLLASMLRSVGVPAKVVTGYTPNATVYHAWNSIYDSSKWNVIDSTYDSQMHKAGRKYSMYKPDKDYKDVVYTY